MIEVFIISAIVALIHNSGFWDNLDAWVNRKFKFYHLPHILLCALCQTWWLSLLFIIITGQVTVFNIFVCLIAAHASDLFMGVFGVLKQFGYTLISWIDKILNN